MTKQKEEAPSLEIAVILAGAGAPWLGPWWAREVANQVASWLPEDVTEKNVDDFLERNMKHRAMPCGDRGACSRAIVRAFNRRRAGPELVATGRSGPAFGGRVEWGLRADQRIAATGRA